MFSIRRGASYRARGSQSLPLITLPIAHTRARSSSLFISLLDYRSDHHRTFSFLQFTMDRIAVTAVFVCGLVIHVWAGPANFPVRRQTTVFPSTCGYENGNPTLPRTANLGFDCRSDSQNSLWGFCPTTVINANDCGLAGACYDSNVCSDGCGIFGEPSITTLTWYVSA